MTAEQSNQHGFSLVELVIAVVVLGIAISPFMFALTEGAKDAVEAERYSTAALLAIAKMETISADRHSPNRGYSYISGGNYAAESPISGWTNYNRTVTITEVSGSDLSTASPGSGYKKVTVTVTAIDLSMTYTSTCIFCELSS